MSLRDRHPYFSHLQDKESAEIPSRHCLLTLGAFDFFFTLSYGRIKCIYDALFHLVHKFSPSDGIVNTGVPIELYAPNTEVDNELSIQLSGTHRSRLSRLKSALSLSRTEFFIWKSFPVWDRDGSGLIICRINHSWCLRLLTSVCHSLTYLFNTFL